METKLRALVDRLLMELDDANHQLGGYFNHVSEEIEADLVELGIERRIDFVEDDSVDFVEDDSDLVGDSTLEEE